MDRQTLLVSASCWMTRSGFECGSTQWEDVAFEYSTRNSLFILRIWELLSEWHFCRGFSFHSEKYHLILRKWNLNAFLKIGSCKGQFHFTWIAKEEKFNISTFLKLIFWKNYVSIHISPYLKVITLNSLKIREIIDEYDISRLNEKRDNSVKKNK